MARQFMPNSPNPPRGMICSFASAIELAVSSRRAVHSCSTSLSLYGIFKNRNNAEGERTGYQSAHLDAQPKTGAAHNSPQSLPADRSVLGGGSRRIISALRLYR